MLDDRDKDLEQMSLGLDLPAKKAAKVRKLSGELARRLDTSAAEDRAAKREAVLAERARRLAIDPRTVPVRFSNLKEFADSPEHYVHAVRFRRDETLAMRIGAGAHALSFDQPYETYFEHRNSKAWDAFKAAHREKHGDSYTTVPILNQDELDTAIAIRDKLRAHPVASKLIYEDSVIEQTIEWEHLGRKCTARPDVRGRHKVVELKTTRSAKPKWFRKDVADRCYHGQLSFYGEGIVELGLGTATENYIIAIESKPPHVIAVYRLVPETMDLGRGAWRGWFETLRICEASDHWPGYSDEVMDLELLTDEFHAYADGDEIPVAE